jgi:hypothetical protein
MIEKIFVCRSVSNATQRAKGMQLTPEIISSMFPAMHLIKVPTAAPTRMDMSPNANAIIFATDTVAKNAASDRINT